MHPNQITTVKEGREAVAELLGQINAYEELLEKALGEPKHMGIVMSEPHNGLYRVVDSDSGNTSFIPVHPKSENSYFENKDVVLFTKNFIVDMMPEVLMPKPEPIEFKRISWDEIGGMKSQVERVRELIEVPLSHKGLYDDFNMDPLNGLLLFGPPGCGKTLIAKAVATRVLHELDEPTADSYMYVKGAELLSELVGRAESNIRTLFKRARNHYKETGVRSILCLDEAESILPRRGSRRSSDVETTIVPTFLAEMNGFEENGPFIILLTNKPEDLDPAIIRDGRIDVKIGINRPTQEDTLDIFKVHLNKTKTTGSIDELATKATMELFSLPMHHNVSGAMIETLVKGAVQKAINRKIKNRSAKSAVTLDDLIQTIQTYESKI